MPADTPTPRKPVLLAGKKQENPCDIERTTILASLPSSLICDLVPYRHFQPSRSAVDIAIRAALPQPAAAELESNEEQQATPLFTIVRLNGVRKCKQTINVARLVPYRHSARAALPQLAAERQVPLFVATSSPAEIAALGNLPLSLGPSPAAIEYVRSLEARRKRFLTYQLQKFRDRLGIPAEVGTYIPIHPRS